MSQNDGPPELTMPAQQSTSTAPQGQHLPPWQGDSTRKNKGPGYLGACDTCRIRRVKCVRLDDDPVCVACKRRSINCTHLRFGGARFKPRQGKRIAAAIATFGRADSGTAQATTSRGYEEPLEQLQLVRRTEGLSETSPESLLGWTEDASAFYASLLDSYIASSHFNLPLVRNEVLQRHFELSGRRPSQMGFLEELLVRAAICFAALQSDHPGLVGRDAPSLNEVSRLGARASFGLYARRREQVCQRLVEDLLQQIDARAVFRTPCHESCAILGMGSDLIAHLEGRKRFELGRPYWSALSSHALQVQEDGLAPNDLDLGPQWHLAINDCFRSAHHGHRLILSEEDMEQHFGKYRRMVPSLDVLPQALASIELAIFGPIYCSWYIAIVDLTRSFASTVSIPFARQRTVDVSLFRHFTNEVARLFGVTVAARRTAHEAVGRMSADVQLQQSRVAGNPMAAHLEAMPLAVAMTAMVLYRKFTEWRRRCAVFQPVSVEEQEGAAAAEQEIADIDRGLNGVMVDILISLNHAVQVKRDSATELFTHHSVFTFPRFHFKWFCLMALRIPCAEAGGPAQFPFALQVEVAQTVIAALRVQSWVWSGMEEDANTCEAALQRVWERANAPHQASAQPTVPLPDATMVPSVSASSSSSPAMFRMSRPADPDASHASMASWANPASIGSLATDVRYQHQSMHSDGGPSHSPQQPFWAPHLHEAGHHRHLDPVFSPENTVDRQAPTAAHSRPASFLGPG